METVHIDLCIRCRRALRKSVMLSTNQLASLIVCREMGLIDVKFTDVVCEGCREGTGDEVADRMMQIQKGGT